MSKKLNKIAVAMSLVAAMCGAYAAQDTADLTVGATVLNNCSISAGTLAFGTDLSLALNAGAGSAGVTNPVYANTGTTIALICTKGAAATLMAGSGTNALAGVRRMKSAGGDYLPYQLYVDFERTQVMDDTHGIAYTGTGAVTTDVDIHGGIAGADLAAAKAGVYADTVTMTIVYTP